MRRPATALLRSPPPRSRPAGARYSKAGEEPALDDLLADPLVHLILARDGLDRDEVRARMTKAARTLRKKEGPGRG